MRKLAFSLFFISCWRGQVQGQDQGHGRRRDNEKDWVLGGTARSNACSIFGSRWSVHSCKTEGPDCEQPIPLPPHSGQTVLPHSGQTILPS